MTTPEQITSGNFYTDIIKKSKYFVNLQRVNDMNLLFPPFMQKVNAIIAESKANNMPLMVFETFRSVQRQQALYKAGETKLENVGLHHYGLAVDIVKDVAGEPSWKGDFEFMLGVAKTYGLVSGLDWGQPHKVHTFIDADHLQFVTMEDQTRVLNNTWYPGQDYKIT